MPTLRKILAALAAGVMGLAVSAAWAGGGTAPADDTPAGKPSPPEITDGPAPTKTPGAAADAAPAEEAAPPADNRVLGWFITNLPDGGAELGYGEPETDNIAIVFSCSRGEGALHAGSMGLEGDGDASHPAGAHWTATFSMSSEGVTGRYQGRAGMNDEVGPMLEDARIPIDDPVITAFAQHGNLTVEEHYPLNQETLIEYSHILAFLTICRGHARESN